MMKPVLVLFLKAVLLIFWGVKALLVKDLPSQCATRWMRNSEESDYCLVRRGRTQTHGKKCVRYFGGSSSSSSSSSSVGQSMSAPWLNNRNRLLPFILSEKRSESIESSRETETTLKSAANATKSTTPSDSKKDNNNSKNNSTIKKRPKKRRRVIDQYAHLVESHPLDDPEPDPPEKYPKLPPMPSVKLLRTRTSGVNPYNIPTDPEEEWEWYYQLLQQRQQQQQSTTTTTTTIQDTEAKDSTTNNTNTNTNNNNNTTMMIDEPIKDSLLRNWMANQRKSLMKTLGILDIGEKANWGTEYMTSERKKRLDDLHFYWGHLRLNPHAERIVFSSDFQCGVRLKYKDWIWNPIYDQLVEFHNEFNHTNVPLGRKDGLGVWAAQQRVLRWDMPSRRRERLDELGFDWDWKDGRESSNINGTLLMKNAMNISSSGIAFLNNDDGATVPVSTHHLDGIINVWSRDNEEGTQARETKSVPWATRVTQLKKYRKAHGDCNVPLDYEDAPGLGRWVKRMRGRKRKLSPRSVMQLEKLGFEFDEDKEGKKS